MMLRPTISFFVVLALFTTASALPCAAAPSDLAWPDDSSETDSAPRVRRNRPQPRRAQRYAPAARARAERQRMPVAPKGRAPLGARANPAARGHAEPKATVDEEGTDTGGASRAKTSKNEQKPAGKGSKAAAKPGSGADDEDDEVEDVEAVEAIAPADAKGAEARGAGSEGWTFNKVLSHFHAAMVHLPIAWVMAWAGCELLALVWRHPFLQMAGLPIGLLSALSFAPSVLSGLMRLDELSGASSGYDVAPALLHRNLNFVSWGLVVLAVVLRLFNCHLRRGTARVLYVGMVVAAFGVMGYSAHLGGVMVYGEEFFPFN